MAKFIKKREEIEAILFTRDNFKEVEKFTNNQAYSLMIERRIGRKCTCTLNSLRGTWEVVEGNYIVKGKDGMYSPLTSDYIIEHYDEVCE